MMVAMALVTTFMAVPLLEMICPMRMLRSVPERIPVEQALVGMALSSTDGTAA
jgi:hypothetical protein